MSRKGAMQRNKKQEHIIEKYKVRRQELKEQIYNKDISINQRMELYWKLQKLPRYSSATRLRNRCSITGRPRGYISEFGISRITFRKLARDGMLAGVRRASW